MSARHHYSMQDLNQQTARVHWQELETHFARGVVIEVASDLDLVEVAACFANDDKAAVEQEARRAAIADYLGIDLGECNVTDSFGGVTSLSSTANLQITTYANIELQGLNAQFSCFYKSNQGIFGIHTPEPTMTLDLG